MGQLREDVLRPGPSPGAFRILQGLMVLATVGVLVCYFNTVGCAYPALLRFEGHESLVSTIVLQLFNVLSVAALALFGGTVTWALAAGRTVRWQIVMLWPFLLVWLVASWLAMVMLIAVGACSTSGGWAVP